MNVFKKYYRRAMVWVGIQKLKPEKEILKIIKNNLRVEEQQACDHKMLSALFPNDIWYRCTNCNTLWIITDAMIVKADKLQELIKKLQMVAGIRPKNKTTMTVKQFKNKHKAQK